MDYVSQFMDSIAPMSRRIPSPATNWHDQVVQIQFQDVDRQQFPGSKPDWWQYE